MADISKTIFDLGRLDRLACEDSPIHRLDPRAKLLVTLAFLIAVVSFDRYAITGLIPFFLYPAALIAMAELPLSYLGKKLAVVAPFAIMVGAANPWLDPAPLLKLGPLSLSAGWVSFISILLRFTLTVSAALILIATTGFNGVCLALARIGVPAPMTTQLLLAYRYLFVLTEEGARLVRARKMRSFARRGEDLATYASLLGHLLLKTVERSRRIHRAMLARGFAGELHASGPLRFTARDAAYLGGWSAIFIFFRLTNLPLLLGRWLTAG